MIVVLRVPESNDVIDKIKNQFFGILNEYNIPL